MGLIKDMHSKNAPKGMMLPKPTTDGDNTVIAAKTGEYVLPPEVVAKIGVDKLDAMVAMMTGQTPGGKPAMMDGMAEEMAEGEMMGMASGGKVQGYARGGLISQIEKGLSNAMTVGASLMPDPVQKRAVDPMEDVRRWMPDTMQMDVINPMAEGLAPTEKKPLMGYAEGGLIEDNPLYRRLSRYSPNQTIPPNATTNASPRAPELRSFTPEAGRLQPGATTPRISQLTQAPQGIAAPSRTVAELDARAAGKSPSMPKGGSASFAPSGNPSAVQSAKPVNSLAARATGPVSKLARAIPGATAFALNQGVNQSFADMDTGYRDEFNRSVGADTPLQTAGADTVRTLANVGDAVTLGLAGRLGRGIASATGGGSFGEGFASDSDRDRFLVGKQQPAAPQMTDKERSDEIARRRAALEGPQSTPAPTQAAPAPVASATPAAPRSAPARTGRGLIAGLAQQQPQAPQQDPALQAAIDASPIASVQSGPVGPEGANGHVVSYKDGRQAFVQQLPEDAKAWYAMTGRAGSNSPVEVIKGSERFVASPESGFQAVPKFVADAGQTGNYVNAAAQGWIDRSAPLAAEARNRIAEINAQGDKQIAVSNATDRDGTGRGLRNRLTALQVGQAEQEEQIRQKAIAGDPQAIQQWNMLRSAKGGNADEWAATSRETPIDPTNPMMGTVKEPMLYNKRTGELRPANTVQSNSTPAGMKQVGTSGGKPVYQDARGNRFIGD